MPRLAHLRTPAATLVALVLLALPAAADDAAERHAAASALVVQMHTTDGLSQIIPDILAQVRVAVTRGDPTLTRQFETFAPQMTRNAEAEKPALLDQITDLYARAYTLNELKGLADFYKTPLGLKMLATQPQISGDMVRVTRDWANRVGQKLLSEGRANLQNATP